MTSPTSQLTKTTRKGCRKEAAHSLRVSRRGIAFRRVRHILQSHRRFNVLNINANAHRVPADGRCMTNEV
jgi:hypothetical protein